MDVLTKKDLLAAIKVLSQPQKSAIPILILYPAELKLALDEGYCRPLPGDIESSLGMPREEVWWHGDKHLGHYVILVQPPNLYSKDEG